MGREHLRVLFRPIQAKPWFHNPIGHFNEQTSQRVDLWVRVNIELVPLVFLRNGKILYSKRRVSRGSSKAAASPRDSERVAVLACFSAQRSIAARRASARVCLIHLVEQLTVNANRKLLNSRSICNVGQWEKCRTKTCPGPLEDCSDNPGAFEGSTQHHLIFY
jgi:hypothetical protein